MHSAALLAVILTHGLIMPPVMSYKGDHLNIEKLSKAVEIFKKHEGLQITWSRNIDEFSSAWYEKRFPLNDKLEWIGLTLLDKKATIDPDKPLEGQRLYNIIIIDCKTEDRAKQTFLELRRKWCPDYSRSGRFLIKSTPEAFELFSKHYGSERCAIHSE